MKITQHLRYVTSLHAPDVTNQPSSPQRHTTLQQWHEAEGWEHEDYVKAGGRWDEIPTVLVGDDSPPPEWERPDHLPPLQKGE